VRQRRIFVCVVVFVVLAATLSPIVSALSSTSQSINNDGDQDVVFVDSNDNLKYVDDSGSVVDLGVQSSGAGGVADADGDGDYDIAFRSTSNDIKYVDYDGNVVDLNVDGYGVGGFGDIDDDGTVDLVYRDLNHNIKFVEVGGSSTDLTADGYGLGGRGDFDGDGDEEVAYSDTNDNIKTVDATGTIDDTGTDANDVGGMGDIDSDGNLEIATNQNNDIFVIDDTGSGSYLGVSSNDYYSGGMADIDGDGDVEAAYVTQLDGYLGYVDDSGSKTTTNVEVSSIGGVADLPPPPFTATPTISNPAPVSTTVSGAPVSLSVDINDSDFSLGDEVTVEFYVDGSLVDTQTTSSNGTVTGTWSSPTDGGHSWYVVATDKNAHTNTSTTWSFSADYAAPAVSNLSPTGQLQSSSPTLEADVTDADFPNDTVDATFYVDGGAVGTDSISSNGTVSTTTSGLTGGDHSVTVEVGDARGTANDSTSGTISVPDTLYVRNESAPSQLVNGTNASVEVTFYGDDRIYTRTTSDGTVSLTGLPVGQQFVVNVDAKGYENRRVVVDSIYNQQSVYLLPVNGTSSDIQFELNDRTGRFRTPTLYIDKPITRDFDNDNSNETRYQTVLADEFGAGGTVGTTLENGQRYRLRVINSAGEERLLGSYTPTADDVVTLTISQISVDGSSGPAEVTFDAQMVDENGQSAVRVIYEDSTNETTELRINVTQTITDNGTTTNVITDTTETGTYGRFIATYPVNRSAKNASYNVTVQAIDSGGSTETYNEQLGNIAGWSLGEINPQVRQLTGWVAIIGLTGLVVIRNPRAAALVAVISGTLFSTLGLISIHPVALGLAGGLAILANISGGDRL